MAELRISATTPLELINEAKGIVSRHKELQVEASELQQQVCYIANEI